MDPDEIRSKLETSDGLLQQLHGRLRRGRERAAVPGSEASQHCHHDPSRHGLVDFQSTESALQRDVHALKEPGYGQESNSLKAVMLSYVHGRGDDLLAMSAESREWLIANPGWQR